ncbi:MAG TPA: preprotein translocase subunit SecG [Lachnospiraceae bacterium]
MHILKIILEIIFVIDCIALAVVVLMQEGKSQGLGALAGGSADTYWGKNKGRSLEGALERATKVMAVLFLLLALALNLKIFS